MLVILFCKDLIHMKWWLHGHLHCLATVHAATKRDFRRSVRDGDGADAGSLLLAVIKKAIKA